MDCNILFGSEEDFFFFPILSPNYGVVAAIICLREEELVQRRPQEVSLYPKLSSQCDI